MRFFARYSAVILSLLVILRVTAQIPNPPTQVDAWYSWILVWVFRPGIAAVLVGIVMAYIVPQRFKMDFPHTWDDDRRKRTTRRLSFISGFIPTVLLWPLGWMFKGMNVTDMYLVWVTGLLAAITVGSAAPFTYTIFMNYLYKKGWADPNYWSAEKVAQLKREGVIPPDARHAVGIDSSTPIDDDQPHHEGG